MSEKISDLAEKTVPADVDELAITDSGDSKKLQMQNLRQYTKTFYSTTQAEISASITPSDRTYKPGDVRRYGALGDGVTDDAGAIGRWLDAGMQGIKLHALEGTVNLSSWSEKAITSPVEIQGANDVKFVGPDTSTNFLSSTANVKISGIEFDTFPAAMPDEFT